MTSFMHPSGQSIRGIFMLHAGQEMTQEIINLMTTINCEILTSSNSNGRIMIKTSRGNLQAIKKSLLAKDEKNTLSRTLNTYICQIIIGGRG